MNKLIVVSGGTKGIGRAIIEKFASEGFDIVTCSRRYDDLKVLKADIEKLYPVTVHYEVVDMSVKNEVEGFGKRILKLDRPISVLVNNAGSFTPGLITDAPSEALESIMAINLFSAYHLTRALVDNMKAARTGHIFSLCSVASLNAYPNGGLYSISKFAMLGFSKSLRQELMHFGIGVTAILAGATLTPSWDGVELPAKRFIKPQDIAKVVYGAYSLSDQSVVEELIIRPQMGDI